jgi:hypothetical protein
MDNINVGLLCFRQAKLEETSSVLRAVGSEQQPAIFFTTTEKATLKTGRGKGHVLCTGSALSVHVVPNELSPAQGTSYAFGLLTC